MFKNSISPNSWLSSIKRNWEFALCTFTNACLNLDRIGRIFDAHQLTEVVITVLNHSTPALDICLVLFEWFLKLLIGS